MSVSVGFATNNHTVVEGQSGVQTVYLPISLSAASSTPVTVQYTTLLRPYGSAVAGEDYVPVENGSITFAPGEVNKLIGIEVLGDKVYESNETFYVSLVGATGAVIVTDGAEGLRNSWKAVTIANDDALGMTTVGFDTNNQSVVEGHSGVQKVYLPISLSAASSTPVTVQYTTLLRPYGSAVAGEDYVPVENGSITFAPGEVNKLIGIEVLGDKVYESNETFYVSLVGATGADIVTDGAEGLRNSWKAVTITNDDALGMTTVGFDTNNQSVVEGHSGVQKVYLPISLSAASSTPVTVQYTTLLRPYGSAVAGEDYVPVENGSITFAPGEVNKLIGIEVLGDKVYESNETFYVSLVGATGAVIVTDGAEGLRNSWKAVTISNDDAPGAVEPPGQTWLGTPSNDTLQGGFGNDSIDGGGGVDTVRYQGVRGDYAITVGDMTTVQDRRSTAQNDGRDTLTNVERLHFSDVRLALDLDGHAGQAAKLLGAVWGRDAVQNKEWVGIALSLLDQGVDYEALAGAALAVTGKTANADVVSLLWTQLLGYTPTAVEMAPITALLEAGGMSQRELALLVAESDLNAQNIGLVGLGFTGIEYL